MTGIIQNGSNDQNGGRGRRGKGGQRDRNHQHVRITVIWVEDTKPVKPKPKPIQSEQESQDLIYQIKIKVNAGVMRKNRINILEIIEVICKLVYTNTRNKAVFHQTTNILLLPNPIEDTCTQYFTSIANLQDLFHYHLVYIH